MKRRLLSPPAVQSPFHSHEFMTPSSSSISQSQTPSVAAMMSISCNGNGHHQADPSSDDSDADSDSVSAGGVYYRPISASDDASDDDDGGDQFHPHGSINPGTNPSFFHLHAENGVSRLHLNGDNGGGIEEEEEEDAVEREREALISRAFRADESRRSAPLPPGTAAQIVDAMRGVSFRGAPPEWAREVPEDQWVDRLRRLRGESSARS